MLRRLSPVDFCAPQLFVSQRLHALCGRMALGLFLLLAAACSQAQTVYLVGTVGPRAILVIDQNPPKTMGVGESRGGVKVLKVQGSRAEVEVNGERLELALGQMPMKIGLSQPNLVLRADASGHFSPKGLINNQAVTFLIDTGASVIALGADQAQTLGLNYTQDGQPVKVSTANGEVEGWLIRLESVQVGHFVQHNVQAIVTPESMPYVLLGNSFLDGFQLSRQAQVMTIQQQP